MPDDFVASDPGTSLAEHLGFTSDAVFMAQLGTNIPELKSVGVSRVLRAFVGTGQVHTYLWLKMDGGKKRKWIALGTEVPRRNPIDECGATVGGRRALVVSGGRVRRLKGRRATRSFVSSLWEVEQKFESQ